MQVTPIKRKFGKYEPGDVFELRDKTAKLLIKLGKLTEAPAVQSKPQSYITRDLRADPAPVVVETRAPEPVAEEVAEDSSGPAVEDAPYGYKADGTPRKRPGRPAASE